MNGQLPKHYEAESKKTVDELVEQQVITPVKEPTTCRWETCPTHRLHDIQQVRPQVKAPVLIPKGNHRNHTA